MLDFVVRFWFRYVLIVILWFVILICCFMKFIKFKLLYKTFWGVFKIFKNVLIFIYIYIYF